MITKEYGTGDTGRMIASGEGEVTMTSSAPVMWAIGDSETIAPVLLEKHSLAPRQDKSMVLAAGEYLWVWGSARIAVTATNPAAGSF